MDHHIILCIFMTFLRICDFSQDMKCVSLFVLLQLFTRTPMTEQRHMIVQSLLFASQIK
jgi:hypothetical protein